MTYNTAAIRELINVAVDDQTLTDLCFDYFPGVYNKFSSGMSRPRKVAFLLEYCKQHALLDNLLGHLQETVPDRYDQFVTAINNPLPTYPSIDEIEDRTGIEIVTGDEVSDLDSDILFVLVRSFIGLLVTVLNIPREQVRVKKMGLGSIVLLVEMPAEAARVLERLYDSQDPVIEELGIVGLRMIETPQILGLVSTALSAESSQDEFYFWVDYRRLVEATQLVRVTMPLPTGDPRIEQLETDVITVIGIVEEVKRQSESRTLGADYARYDGVVENTPLLPPTSFTYACCNCLGVQE